MDGYQQHFEKKMNLVPSVTLSDLRDFPAHWHTHCELLFVFSGEITVGINRVQKRIGSGGLALACSNAVHYYKGGLGQWLLCIFPPSLLGLSTWNPPFREFIIDASQVSESVKKACGQLSCLVRDSANPFLIRGAVSTLCGLLEDSLPQAGEAASPPDSDVQSALDYIGRNYRAALTLDLVANTCNVSKYHLSRKFSSYTGMSFPEYVNALRIGYSLTQLRNTNKSITEIAFDSGFESLRTFHRSFRLAKGISPSKIRKQRP